ncbi:unknown [Roseburia sp. CAG:309]|nr:unknown [Roseburia sp. CAG:309]
MLLSGTLTSAIPAPTFTVQVAFLLLPSVDFTVILAVPSALPVTTPLEETLATFLLLDVQATFLLTFLLGLTFAFNVSFPPTEREAVFLLSVTFLIAAFLTTTRIVAFFLLFFLDTTVIFVFPGFTPFTFPFPLTVAIFLFADLNLTFLFAFLFGDTLTVAVSETFFPFAT